MGKLQRILPFGLVSLLFLPAVHADLIPGILKKALSDLFSGVPAPYVQKSILAIIYFLIFLFAVSFFIKDTSDPKRFAGIRIMLSIVLAVVAGIGTPKAFLTIIFGTQGGAGMWGGVGGLIVILAPVVGLTYLGYKMPREGPGSIGTLLVIFLAIVMLSVVQNIGGENGIDDTMMGQKMPDDLKLSDALSLIQVGLLIWAGFQARRVFIRMGNDRPLSAGALTSSGRWNFPVKEREDRIGRDKRLLRELGRGKKKERAETLEEEEARDERAEESAEAEASGAADAGKALDDEVKREEDAGRVETAEERDIMADADALKSVPAEADDVRRREVMRGALEKIHADVGKLVEQEKTEEKFKKEGLQKLDESFAVMREAEAGCAFAIGKSQKTARVLRRLTSKEFDGLNKYLKKKEQKIKNLIKQQKNFEKKARSSKIPAEAQGFKATANSIGRQAEKLQQELVVQQKKVEQLKNFKQMLDTNQQAIGEVLQKTITPEINDIKKVFADLKRIRKSGMNNLEKTFNAQYKSMFDAFEKNTIPEKLADPANPPETVIPEETAALGGVFAGMISIRAMSKEFFEKTGLPILQDASLVVDKAKGIESALGYLDKAILNLTNAFDEFDEASIDLQDDPKKRLELQEVKKLEDAEVMEENTKVQKEAAVVSQYDTIKASITKDIQDVQAHIRFIEQEMSNTQFMQNAVLGRLEDLQNMLAAGAEKKEVEAERKIEEAEKSAGAAAEATATAAGKGGLGI